jgi:hypothetical protein
MKSFKVHYMNKYPDAHITMSDDALDVYDADGEHRLAMRKNGAGQWVCVSEEMGASDAHDLSPLPKNARRFKLYSNGNIGKSEEYVERSQVAAKLMIENKVLSIKEYEKRGQTFDDKGNWQAPKPAPAQAQAPTGDGHDA